MALQKFKKMRKIEKSKKIYYGHMEIPINQMPRDFF